MRTGESATEVGLLQLAISAANAPSEQIEQLAALLAAAAGAPETLVLCYDSARRLVAWRGNGAAPAHESRLLHLWPAITQAVLQRLPTASQGQLVLPLVAEDQLLGVAIMPHSGARTESEPLLQAIGQLLAGALLRANLGTRTAAQHHEIEMLQAISYSLFRAQHPADLFEYAATAVQHLSGAARSMAFLCDGAGWLQPAPRRNPTAHQHPAIPIHGSQIGRVVQTAQPLITTIATETWNMPPALGLPAAIDMLAVPLAATGITVGVITALYKPGGFSQDDARIIGAYADYVALALGRMHTKPPAPMPAAIPLTKREHAVLRLIAQGHSNQEIARQLTITERTVSTHLSNTLAKLGLTSRTQAALYAVEHGLG